MNRWYTSPGLGMILWVFKTHKSVETPYPELKEYDVVTSYGIV